MDDEFDEELFLAELLQKGYVFCNERRFLDIDKEQTPQEKTIVLFINLNDVFAWGCADAECFNLKDLEVIFSYYKYWGYDGIIKWASIKRNQKPQKPIADDMKKYSHWDEIMEKLLENRYDIFCRERWGNNNK